MNGISPHSILPCYPLRLCYINFFFLGSGAEMGQSPEEYGEILYVCPSVRAPLALRPHLQALRPLWLALRHIQLALRPLQLAL